MQEWIELIKEAKKQGLTVDQTRQGLYEYKALLYAEKYGIIEYTVNGTEMSYFEVYPNEGTYKAVVNLITMDEKRSHIKGAK